MKIRIATIALSIPLLFAAAANAGDGQHHTLALRAVVACVDGMTSLENLADGEKLCLSADVIADQANIVEAHAGVGRIGNVIKFKLDKDAAARLDAFTAANLSGQIGIVLDGQLVMAPVIAEPIRGPWGEVVLNRPMRELETIADDLAEKP